jgi:hypothetical protein
MFSPDSVWARVRDPEKPRTIRLKIESTTTAGRMAFWTDMAASFDYELH